MLRFSYFIKKPALQWEKAISLYFQHAPDISQSRRRTYRLAIRSWRNHGGPENVRSVTSETYQAFRHAMFQEGLRPATIEHYISAISALVRHCGPDSTSCPHGLGLLRKTPDVGRRLAIRSPILPAVRLDVLAAMYDSADSFRFAPAGISRTTWWRSFLAIAYNTGLRISDLIRLQWSNVYEAERKIVFRATKTGRIHELPINDITARHLAMLPRIQDEIFSAHPGQIDYIRAVLRRTCQAVGAAHFSPQSIRRRTACEFERVHPGSGPLILGHSLPSGAALTFLRYIDPLEVVLRPASEKIAQPAAFLRN